MLFNECEEIAVLLSLVWDSTDRNTRDISDKRIDTFPDEAVSSTTQNVLFGGSIGLRRWISGLVMLPYLWQLLQLNANRLGKAYLLRTPKTQTLFI